MVGFISGAQPLEHLNRCLDAGLTDKYRLEAPLQGPVLLDKFTVLVEGGRPDALQLSMGQCRLEHIAGIDGPFSGTGPDDGMNLVDEQDDLAPGLPHLLHHCLEPLLELAAELASRHQ